MSKRNIVPSVLSPYLNLHLTPSRTRDEDSLVVLTSVLGTPTNWLILRFLYSQLSSIGTITTTNTTIKKESDGKSTAQRSASRDREVIQERKGEEKQEEDGEDSKNDDDGQMNVVLVSFLRDWEFWRREAGRLVRSVSHLPSLSTSPFSLHHLLSAPDSEQIPICNNVLQLLSSVRLFSPRSVSLSPDD